MTASAELDEAIAGCLYSAYAHAGQKCSAASRILVDQSLKNDFTRRFVQGSRDIITGPGTSFATQLNPVISLEDKKRLQQTIDRARHEPGASTHLYPEESLTENLLSPAVFEVAAINHRDKTSQSRSEHFGPVVHIIPYKNLNEAVELFNLVEYGLTGGVFSQSEDSIGFLKERLEAGNLYINRSCTGARVAIEPFGGFKHSGTGPKAGSPWYLPAFHSIDRHQTIDRQIPYGHRPPLEAKHPLYQKLVRLSRLPFNEIKPFLKEIDRIEALYEEFIHFYIAHYPAFVRNGQANRKIPGQINYDDLQLKRQAACLVIDREQVSYSTWLDFCTAYLLLPSVQVLITGGRNLQALTPVLQKLQVKLTHSPMKEVVPEYDTFILETENYHACKQLIFGTPPENKKQMPLLLSENDGCHVRDYEGLARSMCLPRSLAVNIMRHGAPIE